MFLNKSQLPSIKIKYALKKDGEREQRERKRERKEVKRGKNLKFTHMQITMYVVYLFQKREMVQ